jgi:hypothetical protein
MAKLLTPRFLLLSTTMTDAHPVSLCSDELVGVFSQM